MWRSLNRMGSWNILGALDCVLILSFLGSDSQICLYPPKHPPTILRVPLLSDQCPKFHARDPARL